MSLDYSFWNVPINDFPKCYNGTKSSDYTHARQCFINITNDQTESCIVGDYCPNTSHNITQCPYFFCSRSKTCVEHDKTCDGICHCLYCEDEEFDDVCFNTFPDAATIKCIEADRPYGINITILAIPCNGIRECRFKNDEDCESKWHISLITMLIFFVLISSGWLHTHFTADKTYQSKESVELIDQRNVTSEKRLKGDALAKFKVYQGILKLLLSAINKVFSKHQRQSLLIGNLKNNSCFI